MAILTLAGLNYGWTYHGTLGQYGYTYYGYTHYGFTHYGYTYYGWTYHGTLGQYGRCGRAHSLEAEQHRRLHVHVHVHCMCLPCPQVLWEQDMWNDVAKSLELNRRYTPLRPLHTLRTLRTPRTPLREPRAQQARLPVGGGLRQEERHVGLARLQASGRGGSGARGSRGDAPAEAGGVAHLQHAL